MKLPEEADCASDELKNIVPPTMNHQRHQAVIHESLPARRRTFWRFDDIARRASKEVRCIETSVSNSKSVSSRDTGFGGLGKSVAAHAPSRIVAQQLLTR